MFKQDDFIFTKHKHKGLSGQKLIATRKADGKRFFVKHESVEDINNEFMIYSIIKELGLRTLEYHLLNQIKHIRYLGQIMHLQEST